MTGNLVITNPTSNPSLTIDATGNVGDSQIDMIPFTGANYRTTLQVEDDGDFAIFTYNNNVPTTTRIGGNGQITASGPGLSFNNSTTAKIVDFNATNTANGVIKFSNVNQMISDGSKLTMSGNVEYTGAITEDNHVTNKKFVEDTVSALNVSNLLDKTAVAEQTLATTNLKVNNLSFLTAGSALVDQAGNGVIVCNTGTSITFGNSIDKAMIESSVNPTTQVSGTEYELFHEGNKQPDVAKLTTARNFRIEGGTTTAFDGRADVNLALPGATETQMGGVKIRFDDATKIMYITTDGTNP
jgi:hypothetical protein